jgi:hypothetical protein
MDGIARSTIDFDADLTGALLPLVAGAIVVLTGLLAIAFVGEILRRAGLAPGFVRSLDCVLPDVARRIAATALTVSVVVLGPTAAHASDAPVRDWLSGRTTSTTTSTTRPDATEAGLIARAAMPATTPTAAQPPVAASPDTPRVTDRPMPTDRIVVVAGDCLWSIAAGRLGTEPTNRAIDDAWRAIYALNRPAIGDDPNLIFPGMQLELPPIDQPPLAAP